VRGGATIVALLCADLHLSHRPPLARSAEGDWYAAMARQLQQLEKIAQEAGHGSGPVPIVCAGDVFDRPNPPVELVNFALEKLPVLYAVPGQHDLLYHRYRDLKKTAFWTLVHAGRLTLLDADKGPYDVGSLRLHGFPWEHKIRPLRPDREHDFALHVAVVHRYLWARNTGHQQAPAQAHVRYLRSCLRGYQVAVFGDNHVPFAIKVGACRIWNCGAFFRRNADQVEHKPSVGLLRQDGAIERRYLDVSQDQFLADTGVKELLKAGAGYEAFVNEITSLSEHSLDVRAVLTEAARQLPKGARRALLAALEDQGG